MERALCADRLAGRRILVTGGGSGIGAASAVRLAAEGASVMVADVREALATDVAKQISGDGGHAEAIACDVASEEEVEAAARATANAFGGLDGLVACAGIATRGIVHELTLADWELVLRVNLTGVFLACKHAVPFMLEAGAGSIVTIGSVSSVIVGAGGSAASYKAAKGGVLQLTRQVAVDYAANNIRANCVCPGAVRTNLGTHSRELSDITTTEPTVGPTKITIAAPMVRASDPSEIGSVVAFLISDDASFMTGSAVMVDGGLTAI